MEIHSTYSLLPLASSILVITLGFFVWIKKPREWLHILFLFYCFTIAMWLFGTFLLFNATAPADQIRWDRFIYVSVVFIPIFLYHFGLIYCAIKRQRWLLILGYLLALFFLPFSQTDYFVSGLYTYQWGVHTVARFGHHVFLFYFFAYFILFFINLYRYYKTLSGQRKKQVGFILVGFAILDIIGPLAYLPAYGLPVFPLIFLSGVPFALIVAYAIIRHNALEVKTIAVEIIVTILNLLALAELIFSRSSFEFLARALVLLSVFMFSVLLVRSVQREIKRRDEVTHLARSLEKANLRLQALDKQKTEFFSIASHQLRTPMSILKGYIELIHDGAFGKATKKMCVVLDNMDETNERLVHLVDDFLDVARIEQGRTEFSFALADMVELVTSVVKELSDRAAGKGLILVWQPPSGGVSISMDAEKIRHVIFNFVDNAIKYSEKGTITVLLDKADDELRVRVRDEGIGFGKLDEANFFQKFYRGANVKAVSMTGTGLGIYVCRKFIEAHGGRVWAKSKGLGQGSEFGFSLLTKPQKKKPE